MRETELDNAAIDFDGIRQGDREALENALRAIWERVGAGLQPDGSTNRDIKSDVGAEGNDGTRREIGCIANPFDCDFDYDSGAGTFESSGLSGALLSGSSFLIMEELGNGQVITCEAVPFETLQEIRKLRNVGTDGVIDDVDEVSDPPIIHASSSERPATGRGVAEPSSTSTRYAYPVTNGDIRILNGISETDEITPSSTINDDSLPVWDTGNDRIYWPVTAAGSGPVVLDVSDPAAVTELGVASLSLGARSLIALYMSPNGTHLYGVGAGVIVVYEIVATGTGLTEVQVFNLSTSAPPSESIAAINDDGDTLVVIYKNQTDENFGWRSYDINTTTQLLTFNSSSATEDPLSTTGDIERPGMYAVFNDFVAFIRGPSTGGSGVWCVVIDISDPTDVDVTQAIALTNTGSSSLSSLRVAGIKGTRIFATAELGMNVETFQLEQISGIRLQPAQVEADQDVTAGRDVTATRLVTGEQLKATTTTKKPVIVDSTTLCDNLNADLLDGKEGARYEAANVWLWQD